jgi:two-component system, NarL family, sensor histidine kinase EvgS
VFAPFSQAESSTTRRFGGTGLGLSISRRLIERMGGHIVIQSEPGKGTVVTATVELPIADPLAVASAAARPSPRDAVPVGTAARILVAEDHPVNQQLVRAQLGMHGWSCEIVDDGEAALAALAQVDYDLLLVDCHMPKVDGYEVAREVRRREAGTDRHLPIVAMTADARADQRERCLAAGMDDLLRKPLRLDAFHEAVARWLGGAVDATTGIGKEDVSGAPPIDMARMRRAFGSDDNIATVMRAGVAATREALGRFDAVIAGGDTQAVAGWIHHVLGGVNVFGDSPVAAEGEALERALREGAVLDAEAVRRFAANVEAFADHLASHSSRSNTPTASGR